MIKTMMTGFAAVAALTMVAGSAQATDSRPASDAPPAARATPAAEATPEQKKYCIVDTLTGSRIAQKICKTREAWLREGFDPLNP
jgi:hypothetical protein